MIELLDWASKVSPLGVAALLALVLYKMSGTQEEVVQLRENHLHEVNEVLARIEVTLARIETLLRRNGHA